MRVFFSAGEASGDAYAAALAREIIALAPDAQLEGIGGRRLRDLGARMVADSSDWGSVGILESLKVAPRVVRGWKAAQAALAEGTPGLCIPIDYGYLNIRLARFAKEKGWKVLYFVPPGSWRRDRQGADLPHVTDAIVTPFPWSAEILRRMGANAHFFGHPLKAMIAERLRDLPDSPRDRIAILPGSRAHEIDHTLPAIAEAVRGLPYPFEFALAPTADPQAIAARWRALGGGDAVFTLGDTYAVFRRARAAVVCSGTATLEAALCGCPCVVVYRGSKAMEIEYRIRRPKFTYISLPNILLDRAVLPELIQWDASPERVRAELEPLVGDTPARAAQLEAFAELEQALGPTDALVRSAALAVEMAKI